MKTIRELLIAALVGIGVPLSAQESKPMESRNQPDEVAQQTDTWTKALAESSKRGTLHDAFQNVRGDSGKWNDDPHLLHAPPIGQKPAKVSLDDWFDQLLEKKGFQTTNTTDNWLLFRTRQLDDNDRVWIESIQRQGNRFTVVLHEAIWQGRYSKTFTFYNVFGVNLGKLDPGKYEARWIIKPLEFRQFEGPGQQQENRSKDERPAERKAIELHATFSIVSEM